MNSSRLFRLFDSRARRGRSTNAIATDARQQREERIDEIMADQERMEGEVYSTMQIIERLRKQLADTERSRGDAEKRYHDQTATMDKERQYYQDTELCSSRRKPLRLPPTTSFSRVTTSCFASTSASPIDLASSRPVQVCPTSTRLSIHHATFPLIQQPLPTVRPQTTS